MSDTTENKRTIRDVVKIIEKKLKISFYEGNILGQKESRKFHGVSTDNRIYLFVCTNMLQDNKIKAGQRASIFEKCYWLSLQQGKTKYLIFTDRDFRNKFLEEYGDYLKDIDTQFVAV